MRLSSRIYGFSTLLCCAALLFACADDSTTTAQQEEAVEGKDGTNGDDGENGTNGTDGKNGDNGTNGKDGASGTSVGTAELQDVIDDAVEDAISASAKGCDAIDMEKPEDGLQLQLPLTVAAGKEGEYCMLVMLDQDLNLNWSDGRYTVGSHHALVERTSYFGAIPTTTITGQTVADATKPHPCATPSQLWSVQGVVAGGRNVEVAESGDDPTRSGKGVLPSNVAYKLKKGEVILVNFHMINVTEEPIDACYKVNLHGIPEAEVEHEAGTLFFYNAFITVPAEGTATARLACPITKDITLRTAVSHMHSRGDGYYANLMDKSPADPTASVVQELYSGTEWEDPVAEIFKPALKLTAGQWIDYECHYTNPEDRDVAQGFAGTDEMCMFVGAYWPRDFAMETCANGSGKTNGSAGIVYGSGDGTGAEFLGCWWNSPRVTSGTGDDPKRLQSLECVTSTCPEASPGIRPYLTCLSDNAAGCQKQCTDAQASFQAVCALTPGAGTTGCAEEYGTNGSDGTCAAGATSAAVAACTMDGQLNAYQEECQATLCASQCAIGAPECAACLGTFTGDPGNTSCMNILVGSCVKDQATKIATKCNTDCFTPCITAKVTGCTVDCLNEEKCEAQYLTLATATCD
jgi:Copper type II ascorbate-dependent monooxygenase, C-terminal domain